MHTPPIVVSTHGLTKRFRHVVAVDNLNLTIQAGEVVAYLGSNGAGKSTTFRLLLNIYRPSEGHAEILGRPCGKLDGPDFDKIAYIAEGLKIPSWMTVAQFVEYCSGFYSEWDNARLDALKESLNIPFDRKLKHLSRGQRMKALFLSTLPSHPRILLLDEPFSGLDVETRAQVSGILRKLAKDDGLTSIITTHDVEEVEPLATRLVVLREGRSVVDEPMAAFLSRHRAIVIPSPETQSIPPQELTFKPSSYWPGKHEGWVDCFDDQWESAFRQKHPELSDIQILPMNLRSILVAKSLNIETRS